MFCASLYVRLRNMAQCAQSKWAGHRYQVVVHIISFSIGLFGSNSFLSSWYLSWSCEEGVGLCSLRGALKKKNAETWEKFPTGGGHQKCPKFQLGKVQKEGGGHHISKKSQVSKSLKVWKIMHYVHLVRTLKQKNLYFVALKMANNTLILQMVVDFVSNVPIFKFFLRFWRGSFCLKMFPSSSPLGNFSQVSALFNFEGSPNMPHTNN